MENLQNQVNETGTVIVSEDMPEFLRKVSDKLDAEGEVLVQTSEDVGTEQPQVA